MHVGVYAGVPAANSAFALAVRVLREEGVLPAAEPTGAGAHPDEPDGLDSLDGLDGLD
jgi:hypothetical protein